MEAVVIGKHEHALFIHITVCCPFPQTTNTPILTDGNHRFGRSLHELEFVSSNQEIGHF